MRQDIFTSILSELNGSSADIEASAVISTDGLIMASLLPAGLDEDRVGAMSAAMLSLGSRIAKELARGELDQVLVKGENGYVLMTSAGSEAVLSVIAKPLRNETLNALWWELQRQAGVNGIPARNAYRASVRALT